MGKLQIFVLILTLILALILIFDSTTGSFVFIPSPKIFTLVFSFILISLVSITLFAEGPKAKEVKEWSKGEIPSTIQIEIPESMSYIEDIEEVYKLLKSYFPRAVYKKIVKESGENFSLDDLKEMPYGKNMIVIRFTGKDIDEKLRRRASDTYNPHGIFYGNNIVISIKSLYEIYSKIPRDVRIKRQVLHELYHIAGGNDNPHEQGIKDPFLRYDPTEDEIEFIKKGLEEKLYET
ncbi:MAG: hypothetical protein QXU74_02310 [Candidatus Aenigmatarchaeota archaeon]